MTKREMFKLVAKANGLRGRQRITDVWQDGADRWVFDSNARGGYGETLTFHYATDADLLNDIGIRARSVAMLPDGNFKMLK